MTDLKLRINVDGVMVDKGQIKAYRAQIKEDGKQIAELEKENAELKAHVERLREAILSAKATIPTHRRDYRILHNASVETPQCSLAKIQSDAVKAFGSYMFDSFGIIMNEDINNFVETFIDEESLLEGKE